MLVLAFLGLFFVCFWFPSCILPVYPLGSFFSWFLMHLLIYQKKKMCTLVGLSQFWG